MTRYFQVIEIDRDTFIEKTGTDLDEVCLTVTDDGFVYAAVDDSVTDEFVLSLYDFHD